MLFYQGLAGFKKYLMKLTATQIAKLNPEEKMKHSSMAYQEKSAMGSQP